MKPSNIFKDIELSKTARTFFRRFWSWLQEENLSPAEKRFQELRDEQIRKHYQIRFLI